MKIYKLPALLILIPASFFSILSNSYAQEQSAEVKNLTSVVEIKLEKVKKTDAANHAQEEINIVEGYINETKRLMKEGEFKRAYYVISIAISYFNLISAKSELYESKNELTKIKEKLNE